MRPHQRRAHLIESAHGHAKEAPGQHLQPYELGQDQQITPALLEVLQWIADDATDQQIADYRWTELCTTKTQVCRILERLHVHHRAAAVAEGFRRGLLH